MANKVTIEQRLKEIMKIRNINLSKLSDISKISKSSLHSYLQGKNKPKQNNIYRLAQALNVSESYLMGWTDEISPNTNSIIEKLTTTAKQLNEENQNKTYQYATNLLNYQNRTVKEVFIEYSKKELKEVLVTEKVAAGIGYCYGNNEVVSCYTDRDDLMPYDMATRVFGDSMEPELMDGDIILLQRGYDNVNGDIYVVDYDGKSYVKKLYNDGNRFVLKSINKKYPDITIYTSDIQDTYFNIVGKVVDSFTPVEK